MAERRFSFAIEDETGARQAGELVIMRRWQAGLAAARDAAFTIVLVEEPLPDGEPPPRADRLAVCAPARPVHIERTIGEQVEPYQAGPAVVPAIPLRLPAATMSSFGRGTIVAAATLSIYPGQVFPEGEASPRLELLARALLAAAPAARRLQAYWRAADGMLAWPEAAGRVPSPANLRLRLKKLLTSIGRGEQAAFDAPIARLDRVAGGESPSSVYRSPGAFADEVALARCLIERPSEAAQLEELRAYVDAARVPESLRNLSVDRAIVREQLSYGMLLSEPERLEAARASFEVFRSAYASAYLAHHERYWRTKADVRDSLLESAPAAHTLARLNSLRQLGAPDGLPALVEFERLTLDSAGCPARGLERMLTQRARCPGCRLTLEAAVPEERARDVVRQLQQALRRKQRRLASRAVQRILARGGERIEQFLQIVQASDLDGLTNVLDDDLLGFLRELLQELGPAPRPVAEAPRDLLLDLVRAYPSVTEEQVEAVTRAFRALLEEALHAERERGDAQPARVRLARPAPAGRS